MSAKNPLFLLGLAASLLVGIFLGSSAFTFVSAQGTSYLTDDPNVCVNCHVMREQYDGWRHGSHHATATCNDCHLPHDNVVHKLFVKASNGYHHSKAFTLQDFHEPIQIKARNAEILQASCLHCHGDFVAELVAGSTTAADAPRCVHCHAGVGHGAAR